jgi:hypothetical protein
MKLSTMKLLRDKIGLCRACRHARLTSNQRGSKFYLCRLSENNPRFPKYPRLPVLACEGYESTADPEPSKGGPSDTME